MCTSSLRAGARWWGTRRDTQCWLGAAPSKHIEAGRARAQHPVWPSPPALHDSGFLTNNQGCVCAVLLCASLMPSSCPIQCSHGRAGHRPSPAAVTLQQIVAADLLLLATAVTQRQAAPLHHLGRHVGWQLAELGRDHAPCQHNVRALAGHSTQHAARSGSTAKASETLAAAVQRAAGTWELQSKCDPCRPRSWLLTLTSQDTPRCAAPALCLVSLTVTCGTGGVPFQARKLSHRVASGRLSMRAAMTGCCSPNRRGPHTLAARAATAPAEALALMPSMGGAAL